ncbi:MAG: DUF1996 domain-containing protein [Ilumatobacter sp.]
MKFRIAMAGALVVTGVVGASLPAHGQVSPTDGAPNLVVTSNQNVPTKGGYVVNLDGDKVYVNSVCKAQLVAAGIAPDVHPWSALKPLPTVAKSNAPSCDDLEASFADAPDPGDGGGDPDPGDGGGDPDPGDGGGNEMSPVRLFQTAGTTSPTKGGFVIVNDATWTRVSPSCKADLIAEGIEIVSATWSQVSAYPKESLPCDLVLAMLTAPGHGDDGEWVTMGDESATYPDDQVPEKYFLFDPDWNPDPTWEETRIGWLVECESVKFDQIDPIVVPGPDMQSHHMHEFFGNGNVTSESTTQTFADTPLDDIECTDVNDKSAYWSPAVYQDGQRATANNFKAYYKSTTPDAVPMPFGLRMIAGDVNATGDQGELVGWFEVQRTSDLTPREDLTNTLGETQMISRPNDENNIVLRMNFPNCWDGVHLDSPDHQSHMAYFDEVSKTCPATHPVKIPQLTTFTQYDVDGGQGFRLSSGAWYTYHQDFWNAWSPAQMSDLNDACIVDQLNCRVRSSPALNTLGQYPEFIPS